MNRGDVSHEMGFIDAPVFFQYSLFKDSDSINVKVINDLGPHH